MQAPWQTGEEDPVVTNCLIFAILTVKHTQQNGANLNAEARILLIDTLAQLGPYAYW